MAILLLWLLLFKTHSCENIYKLFEEINENVKIFNSIAADIAWQSSVEPAKDGLAERAAKYQQKKISWQHSTCKTLTSMHDRLVLNSTQERQAYLLCRGPKYYYKEAREMSNVYEELQLIYSNIEVCIPGSEHTANLTAIETAILKYISTVTEYLNSEHPEQNSIGFASKMAINGGRTKNGFLCLKGEADFEKIMEFSRKPKVLEWVWSVWREKVKEMRAPYRRLVDLENKAARRNGYRDMGDSWREELELSNLRAKCQQLYRSVRPLYALLHGMVRFYLRREYGDAVDERGPIPAHLLGNLWSQNWEPLADMILPKVINLDDRIKETGWTVHDMIKRAEDFYISLGLPPMTEKFWRESVLSRENHDLARCHGTAADMFQDGDFRLLYCSGVTFEDFYVIHHEMGHIQYYMAYENQPALFRQANTALHESIGDTIMYGVMTPQHLHRLRLINDSELYTSVDIVDSKDNANRKNEESKVNTKNDKEIKIHKVRANINKNYEKPKAIIMNDDKANEEFKVKSNLKDNEEYEELFNNLRLKENNQKSSKVNEYKVNDRDKEDYKDEILDLITTDDILMLKQALNKLPQIPFSLLMDEYRWRYFEGSLDKESLNQEFWEMARKLQGIAPPVYRGEEYFDVGAKFHVPDNTPYIRYFLSSFLQHQIFESLCKAAVFGHRNVKEPLPDSISLNRCDIYGSKAAGKILKDIMSRGASQNWKQILQETTGETEISAVSLKRYYRPLYKLLMRLVEKYDIPIGW
ncbi:angiotensin-converting enzyme-like [Maniola jurtina]|uniref:angiotensin-converting enzyme-like n=1 Tax=Maniola jurtina TaxID=191418 RepID=UPI001E68A590|nr:angiotensin-converting enzyme-like [Maniola jurtina]